MARWYGGQAAVPISRSFSSRNRIIRFGFSSAFVSWYRYDLLAEPPPLAMNRNLYASGCPPGSSAYSSICAGRLVPVLRSSHMVSGASCEYRRFSLVYASYTPRAMDSSSCPSVSTYRPRLPITIAVPVSWHMGSTPPAAMLALRSRSSATKRSFGEAAGSSMMLRSWARWAGRR